MKNKDAKNWRGQIAFMSFNAVATYSRGKRYYLVKQNRLITKEINDIYNH